jgi:hypothetical protein
MADPWSVAGVEELADYPVVWKTSLGAVQKDHFEVNSDKAVTRVVIVPGSCLPDHFAILRHTI